MKDLRSKYGQFAIITGASSGMGAEFARQLARAGLDLVLVARRRSKLAEIAEELQNEFGTRVEIVELDLLDGGAIDELTMRTKELDIGLVVLAAGIFTAGPFTSNELSSETEVITLGALRPMQLTHHYANAVRRATPRRHHPPRLHRRAPERGVPSPTTRPRRRTSRRWGRRSATSSNDPGSISPCCRPARRTPKESSRPRGSTSRNSRSR